MTSQSCAECGTRAEPGQSFCDSCGAVLSWSDREERPDREDRERREVGAGRADQESRAASARGAGAGEPVSVPAGEPAVAAGVREETRSGGGPSGSADAPAPGWDAFARSGPGGTGVPRTALARLDESAPAPRSADPATPEPPQGADADTLPQPAVPTGATTPAPTSTPTPALAPAPAPEPEPDDTAARVRSLLVPVSDPEPRTAPEPSVAPVLPGLPVADRPQVRTPGRDPGVQGGLPCPWCATPNMPDRHFCGRCAMPMQGQDGGEPGRRLPWWRRLLDLRGGETPWAGDRPRLRRGFGRVWNWVVGALVLTLLVAAVMNVGDAVNGVRDHFAKRAPADPDKVIASRSYPGHKPELAFDKRSNTWWGPGVTQSGEGQWIEARFAEPTRLLDVLITPGVSARAETLSESALPKRVEAQITTADGKKTTRILNLDQGAGAQTRAFRVGSVTSVRFVILSAHAASGDKQVAIAEIEFFGRSNGDGS
ncbi:zinc ribbon domain-containing protein [Streptomyces sp. NBC_01390]|uniref:NADase-type glycan-binding domain-containing protein n=1 Tax=Streptomyces sp. NBC_01390 TaxID=2903850 RepID=UPI00324C8F52